MEEVKKEITELDKRFNNLKDVTRECLEKRQVVVSKVANALTSLSPDEEEHHKMFLQNNVEKICTAVNHSVLFCHMNFHWNYLDPSLLEYLVRKFDLKEVKVHIETYGMQLQQFRIMTPLHLFCQAQRKKKIKFSPDFWEVVIDFKWSETVTLEVVEQFRQEYASHYNLYKFAMMLAKVRPGSFIVTWFIPQSIVEKIKCNVPQAILEKYFVTKLTVAGVCIYNCNKEVIASGKHSECVF